MGEKSQRWLVKLSTGRIVGPLDTSTVLQKIDRGEFGEGEHVSLYPNTNWVPIARNSVFYDKLLSQLDDSIDGSNHQPIENFENTNSEEDASEEEKTQFYREERRASRQRAKADEDDGWGFSKGIETEETLDQTQSIGTQTVKISDDESVIELVDVNKEVRKQKKKKAVLPLLVAVVAVLSLVFVFIPEVKKKERRARLLYPKESSKKMTEEEAIKTLRKGVALYSKDDLRLMLKAQNKFVAVVEGVPNRTDAMAMLCLTYHEIWPYSYQDKKDQNVIERLSILATKIDPTSIDAATCRIVNMIAKGKYQEAKISVESILDGIANSKVPPTALYYFKAKLLKADNKGSTAIGYLRSAQQLWPAWVRPHVLEARYLMDLNRPAEAASKLRSILNVHPEHKVALISMGLVLFRHYRHYQESKQMLLSAFKSKSSAPNSISAEGYLGLAEIYMNEKSHKNALKYAKKCYYENSTNKACKNLVASLGGRIEMSAFVDKVSQLIIEGDQFVREGDCSSAQAIYKTAYELNAKNGIAAQKAGECLWKLSLSTEAIVWLNRAIQADPNLISAYIILAEYYSFRFDFVAAARILAKASKISKKNFEVYRGYAQLELNRRNPKSAIRFAKKALALNSGDVESHVLLAKASRLSGDLQAAYASSSKAIELESTHKAGQVEYCKAMVAVQGIDVGLNYVSQLIDRYPQISEYRQVLGEIYLDDERYAMAEAVFFQIVQIKEKPKNALLLLSSSLAKQGKFDSALDALLKAAMIDPSDPEALFQAGKLYLDTKKASQARVQFQRVLRINPNYPLVHYYLGLSSMRMGDAKGALDEAMLERQQNPRLAAPYLLAAEAYTKLGQYSLCAGEYQKAVKLSPGGADIYVKMSVCYVKTGNLDIAVQMLNYAAKLDAGNPSIYRELGSIYERQGNMPAAAKVYEKYFILNPAAVDRKQIERRMSGY